MQATLRLPANLTTEEIETELESAFINLFDIYGSGGGFFDVSVTSNVVLQGPDGRFSIYYGQDFGARNTSMAPVTTVYSLEDVQDVPVDLDLAAFEAVFFANHEDTHVRVDSMVNLVYIITRYLSNFDNQRASRGRIGLRLVYD